MHFFQQEAIKQANQSLSMSGKALLVMANGTGKSQVACEIAQSFMHSGQVLIVVEMKLLSHQFQNAFNSLKIESTVVDPKNPTENLIRNNILITTVANLGYIETIASKLNINLMIVMDGYSSRKVLLKRLSSPYLNVINKCLISNVDYREARQIAGNITFMYGMPDAFEDGILNKFETVSVSGMDVRLLNEREGQNKLAGWIIRNIYKKKSKIIIICKDYNTASNMADAINESNGYEIAKTITSHDANPYLNIELFRTSEAISIAVTISFFYVFNNVSITDVILLKKITSYDDFSKIITSCARSDDSEPRLWDFAENKKYYFDEMGVFHRRSLDLKVFNKAKDSKLITPLDDCPTEIDMLGRIEIVELLDNILTKGRKDNLCLALLGKWGMGKSSVIAMLKSASINRANLRIINYNAWHEEHSDNVLSSIANKIIDELYDSKNILQQLALNLKSRLLSARTNLRLELVILLPLCILVVHNIIKNFGLNFSSSLLTTTLLGAIFSLFITTMRTYLDSPVIKRIREIFKRKNFSDYVGLGQTIKSHLSNLFTSDATPLIQCVFPWASGNKQNKKYIIAIDDLDRCSDQKIIDTISTLQLLSTMPNVNIILAIDYDVLIKAFMLKWQNQDKMLTDEMAMIKSRVYLGKIFQASIEIDTPARDKINHFIHKCLYKNVKKDLLDEFELPSSELSGITTSSIEEISSIDIDEFTMLEVNEESKLPSDEFLEESHYEYEIFIECAKAFNMGNPRTLVRLHNTITFIKGLNPDIMQSKDDVAMHIYLTFWYETWCGQTDIDKRSMETAISTRNYSCQDKLHMLTNRLDINSFTNFEMNLMLNNVIKASLPFNRAPQPFTIDSDNDK